MFTVVNCQRLLTYLPLVQYSAGLATVLMSLVTTTSVSWHVHLAKVGVMKSQMYHLCLESRRSTVLPSSRQSPPNGSTLLAYCYQKAYFLHWLLREHQQCNHANLVSFLMVSALCLNFKDHDMTLLDHSSKNYMFHLKRGYYRNFIVKLSSVKKFLYM